ncbi:MAG TPA: hypothetical protein VF746_31350 [Longimicrobium sp.]|jgi:hypothetical protein
MRRFTVPTGACLAMLLALTPPPAAHGQAPAPSVPAPDTLGANFDADRVGRGTPGDFDFLIGTWSFRFQSRDEQGGYRPVRTGTWTAVKTHGGAIVEDVWRVGETENPTITWRVFNPQRGVWEIQGVQPRSGQWHPGIAWSEGDQRFVVQTFGPMRARIRYYQVTPDHFLWRADGSEDGGRTWVADIWKIEAHRVNL